MLVLKFFIAFLLFFVGACCGSRILCIASVPTFSHSLFFRPIWKALADRGHELTVLTTNPMEEPYKNIKEIDLNFVYERKAVFLNITWTLSNIPKLLMEVTNLLSDVGVMELDHPEVQNLLRNNSEHFDLVIAETHVPLMFGFAHKFRCPLIGITSSEVLPHYHKVLGNPTHPALFPEPFSPYVENNLLVRIINFSIRIYVNLIGGRLCSKANELSKIYFGPDVPTVTETIRKISFIFINVHPLFNLRPLGSKFVTIGGGAHIENPKPLPKNIQELLDNSPQGVVYFSLGTSIKEAQYPPNFINTTLEALRELPYQIIWKFDQKIAELPPNIKIFEWLPQQDLLRHPNVKVFITQGGLHSMEESINAEVPMVGIAFISDQNKNIRNIVNNGIGIRLDKNAFTKEDMKRAVMEIMGDIKYKENVAAISHLLKDQPMSGLEKAVWYAEFAIRNKHRQHLLPTPPMIPWYQYFLLDIIGTLCFILLGSVYVIYRLLKLLFKLKTKLYLPGTAKTKED